MVAKSLPDREILSLLDVLLGQGMVIARNLCGNLHFGGLGSSVDEDWDLSRAFTSSAASPGRRGRWGSLTSACPASGYDQAAPR